MNKKKGKTWPVRIHKAIRNVFGIEAYLMFSHNHYVRRRYSKHPNHTLGGKTQICQRENLLNLKHRYEN